MDKALTQYCELLFGEKSIQNAIPVKVNLTKPLIESSFIEKVCEENGEGILVDSQSSRKGHIINIQKEIHYFKGRFVGIKNGLYGFIEPFEVFYSANGGDYHSEQESGVLLLSEPKISHLRPLSD